LVAVIIGFEITIHIEFGYGIN